MATCDISLADDLHALAGRAASLLRSLQAAQEKELNHVAEIASLEEAIRAGERREGALKAELAAVKKQVQRQQDDVESKFKRNWRGALSFLGALELPAFASVSKSFAEFLNDDSIWRDMQGGSDDFLAHHNHKASLIAKQRNKQVVKLQKTWTDTVSAFSQVLLEANQQADSALTKCKSDLRIAKMMQDYYRTEYKKFIVQWTISQSALAVVGWRQSIASPDFQIRGLDGHFELFPWYGGKGQSKGGCSSLYLHMHDDDVRVTVSVLFGSEPLDELNWHYKSGNRKKAGGWAVAPRVNKSGIVIQAQFDVAAGIADDVFVTISDSA